VVRARTVEWLKEDSNEFLGRRVKRVDRTDGLKLEFSDGSWILLRLSGTEPLVRVYTEAASADAASRLAEDAREWIFKATSGQKNVVAKGKTR
jgi:phosphomannomutase